jgi:hypothetical protein
MHLCTRTEYELNPLGRLTSLVHGKDGDVLDKFMLMALERRTAMRKRKQIQPANTGAKAVYRQMATICLVIMVFLLMLFLGCARQETTNVTVSHAPKESSVIPEPSQDGDKESYIEESLINPEQSSNVQELNQEEVKQSHEPDALKNLTDKTSATLTISDLKLLLEAPADVINETFNIKREDINQWMMGNTATAPIKDVELAYGQINGESLPAYLDSMLLWYSGKKGTEIIDEILNMQEWGDAPIEEFGHAMGFSGEDATPIKAINYEKDGLSFSFRVDYNNAFLPKETQDETISLVIIRRLEVE